MDEIYEMLKDILAVIDPDQSYSSSELCDQLEEITQDINDALEETKKVKEKLEECL